jgi:hypothetical protein
MAIYWTRLDEVFVLMLRKQDLIESVARYFILSEVYLTIYIIYIIIIRRSVSKKWEE